MLVGLLAWLEQVKDDKGEPTKKAMALKKWGFGSVEAARSFCNKNKNTVNETYSIIYLSLLKQVKFLVMEKII